jgi:aldehyde:ferredoxin oxidoreductase
MKLNHLGGYTGKILRIDLSEATTTVENIDEDVLRNYIGGVGIGVKILYDEVLPGTAWSDRENRLIFASGPLNGTIVPGSGTICAVTKGCLTNGGASSQANGYFGAYLKMAGFDIVIIQGASATWQYIYIHDGIAEIRDASHLVGKDTVETEKLLKEGLGGNSSDISVYGIGPAGEHLVKFSMIFGDQGHVLAHNGFGAVMGSKRLKAIAVAKGELRPSLKDKQ